MGNILPSFCLNTSDFSGGIWIESFSKYFEHFSIFFLMMLTRTAKGRRSPPTFVLLKIFLDMKGCMILYNWSQTLVDWEIGQESDRFVGLR